MMIRTVLLLMLAGFWHLPLAQDYALEPTRIAPDTFVFNGLSEDFSRENGGNIVNTGFIVTDKGVIVIDVGPSLQYGQQMRQAINTITNKPVVEVYLTHHHPDHFGGMQAFDDVRIHALAATVNTLEQQGEGLIDNLYRLLGDWMRGTEFTPGRITPLKGGERDYGNHRLRLIALQGHTEGDLVILDETTGVLFTGDLVFNNRALTTPNANPEHWLLTLDYLDKIDYSIIVPGHGPVTHTSRPVSQTRDYLAWLEATLTQSVQQGMDMNEALQIEIPKRFHGLAVLRKEYARSISHRYPELEFRYFVAPDTLDQ
ncbi:MAG: quinoprotein relay system zinc metallohydrolase 1 [Thiotrichales bacterium]|nr:quinoprotein relay system zinc metallohydrolase 1 [Thiotrichales bacterium]